jgi:hypothetical protein
VWPTVLHGPGRFMCRAVPPNGLQQRPKHGPQCFTGQARPIDLWVMPCLGQANLCMPRPAHLARPKITGLFQYLGKSLISLSLLQRVEAEKNSSVTVFCSLQWGATRVAHSGRGRGGAGKNDEGLDQYQF